jgi:peptidoglycan/LPS O-acetylase OafA/YrhL
MSTAAPAPRRHDLDWLRIAAIVALVFFHSAMPFVADSSWHIRNNESSHLLTEANFILSRFRMALLFVIAGVSTQFVLASRTPQRFLRDRAVRLLVPLAFGILVVVPPQIYAERLADGDFAGNYLMFWPRVLHFAPYPSGDTSYHHLWFVLYLFLYSVLLLPVMVWSRRASGAEWLARARAIIAARGVHWLSLPVVLVYALLLDRFSGLQDVVHDGAMFLTYFGYFAVGWFVGTDDALWRRLVTGRTSAFRVAVVALLCIETLRWTGSAPSVSAGAWRTGYLMLLGANAWAWVITLLGFGARWLNHDHAVLRWAREASYPIYILHQTVIVLLAFRAVQSTDDVLAKFAFTSLGSLVITVSIYQTLVRPFGAMCVLFGLSAAPATHQASFPRASTVAALGVFAVAVAPRATDAQTSVMAGGMIIGESRLLVGRVAVSRSKWSLVADITRDALRQQWAADGAVGVYRLDAAGLSLRRYGRQRDGGVFLEIGGGSARPDFVVTESSGIQTRRKAKLAVATAGIGTRREIPKTGLFLEVAYRHAIPLATVHLFPDEVPPVGSTSDFVSFRSWYFERGRGTGQVVVGLGLTL